MYWNSLVGEEKIFTMHLDNHKKLAYSFYRKLVLTNIEPGDDVVDQTSISPSLEDYLEVILDLKEENESIRVTDLAAKLQVAKPSVNQAVTKLVDLKLLTHDRYGPLVLTEAGEAKARKVRDRHRMLTRFFSETLGVDPQIAEQDACGIEHYISPITMEKLIDYVAGFMRSGCPENCPGNRSEIKKK
jgi:DtxR family Mn-dependent transcriptional regulator